MRDAWTVTTGKPPARLNPKTLRVVDDRRNITVHINTLRAFALGWTTGVTIALIVIVWTWP